MKLAPRQNAALDAIRAHVRAHLDPLGVVVSGSIIRGDAGPTSDFDVVVIHGHPWRRREQRRFEGVPVEIFINPPSAIRDAFRSQHAEGKPSMAHMLTTGVVDGEADSIVQTLISEAADWMTRPLEADENELTRLRYGAVDLLDDARDVHKTDRAAELLLLGDAVARIVHYRFRLACRFQPRRKDAVRALQAIDPVAGDLLQRFSTDAPEQRLATVVALAWHVLGADEFFEWTSPDEPVV